MSDTKFKREMLGDFTPDQRDIDLHERLDKYYEDTPDSMNNKDARFHFEVFRTWCSDNGYTHEEVTRAKRNAR